MEGQTGSGKTHTMLGDSSDLTTAAGPGAAGLIPRICIELFQRVSLAQRERSSTDSTYRQGQASIRLSFCEIYKEQVRDLFSAGGDGRTLRVREHPTKGAFVEGLSARPITCYQQVQHLLDVGMSSRATAATAMNEVSSRSHAICTIFLAMPATAKALSHGRAGDEGGEPEEDDSVRTSKIYLVDLAGSERVNATGAKGERLREASSINKSLSTLGDVIKALAKQSRSGRGVPGCSGTHNNGENFIPYRNSMLTWLLKDSLGGNSKTVMLATISPVAEAYQETMSTLRYVERAKDIVNTISVNETSTNPLVEKLREEVRVLQGSLEQKNVIILQHEEKEAALEAVLEREYTNDGDKDQRLRAMTAADRLQEFFDKDKQRQSEAEAMVAEAATKAEQQHRHGLENLTKNHQEAVQSLRRMHEHEVRRIREEEITRHRRDLDAARKIAEQKVRQLSQEWEQALEVERTRLEEKHEKEKQELVEENKQAAARASMEANGAAKTVTAAANIAAESAARELQVEREKNEGIIAERDHAANARRLDELSRLREELEDEKCVLLEEAQRTAEINRAAEVEKATAGVESDLADKMAKVQRQHKTRMDHLRHELTIAAKVSATEERKRLQTEHREVLQAAIASMEAELEAKYSANSIAELSALSKKHEGKLERLEGLHAQALARAAEAAEDSKANVEAEWTKIMKDLKWQHQEEIRKVDERHKNEVNSVTDASNVRREADLASASAQAADALNAVHKDAERTRATFEERQRAHAADLQMKFDESLSAAAADYAADMVALKEANKEELIRMEENWRANANEASASAETRRVADLAEAEAQSTKALAEARRSKDLALAAERQRHQDELRDLDRKQNSELEELRVSEEARRASEVAAVGAEHQQYLAEIQAEHEEGISDLKKDHQQEIEALNQHHQDRIEEIIAIGDAEKRERDSDTAKARAASESAIAMLKADVAAATAKREANHLKKIHELEDAHRLELERILSEAEDRRLAHLAAAREELNSSLSTAEVEAAQSILNLRREHEKSITALTKEHEAELARREKAAERSKESDLAAAAERFAKEREQFEATTASHIDAIEENFAKALRTAQDEGEAERQLSAASLETRLTEERRSMSASVSTLKEKHLGEIASARADAKKCCLADLEAADALLASTIQTLEARAAEEIASVSAKHATEMRNIRQEIEREAERFARLDSEQKSAMQAEATTALDALRAEHQEDLKRITDENIATVQEVSTVAAALTKAELAAAAERARASMAEVRTEMKTTIGCLEDAHHKEIQHINDQWEAEQRALVAAEEEKRVEELANAGERLASALSDAKNEAKAKWVAQEREHQEALGAQNAAHEAAMAAHKEKHLAAQATEAKHNTSVASELSSRLAAAEKVSAEVREALVQAEDAKRHLEAANNEHIAALHKAEEDFGKQSRELEQRAEMDEAFTEEAGLSAKEAIIRTEALEEMLQVSVGSREKDLASHRIRIAELQSFVARQENEDVQTTNVSPSAACTIQRRMIDLRAISASVGAKPSLNAEMQIKPGAFASSGLLGDLTPERYILELENVLIRSTMETATARQDHMKSDAQLKSVTRQLVNLKLVHAQLRERLEDTQVKLEHRSQSAARRWLASAVRLAHEFGKPDRRLIGPLSPKGRLKVSRAMSINAPEQKAQVESPTPSVKGDGCPCVLESVPLTSDVLGLKATLRR